MNEAPEGPIVVKVDVDIEDLIPTFLKNRAGDVRKLAAACQGGDFQTVQSLGHSMKGSGGGYGFDRITEIGAALEQAGKAADAESAGRWIGILEDYLQRVEVVYE